MNLIKTFYSHFNFLNYAHLLKLGRTVINYSADSIKAALNAFKILPTVINVNVDFWEGKKTQVIEGVKIVKCPAEADKKLNCRSCGAGRPLCARLDRDYIIGFTDHGTFKKKASDSNTRGGCYATGGHVAQLRSYLHGALQAGIDPDKLQDTLVMIVVYAGFPTALMALDEWRKVRDSHAGRSVKSGEGN